MGVVGQGHRSKAEVKKYRRCFDFIVCHQLHCFEVKAKGQGHGQKFRVNVLHIAVGIRRLCLPSPANPQVLTNMAITSPWTLSVCL